MKTLKRKIEREYFLASYTRVKAFRLQTEFNILLFVFPIYWPIVKVLQNGTLRIFEFVALSPLSYTCTPLQPVPVVSHLQGGVGQHVIIAVWLLVLCVWL